MDLIIKEYKLDVICVTEHFLTCEKIKRCHIHGYHIGSAFCREHTRGGGTMIMLKNALHAKERNDIKDMSIENEVEMAAVEIEQLDALVVSIYRPPSGNINLFRETICELLDLFNDSTNMRSIFCVGDFNIDFSTKNSEADAVVDVFGTFNLHRMFHEYSRVTKTSKSCIDNIFSNIAKNDCTTTTIELHIADHMGQMLRFGVANTPKTMTDSVYLRDVSSRSMVVFKQMLTLKLANLPQMGKDAKTLFDFFHGTLVSTFESSFPMKEKRIKLKTGNNHIIKDENLMMMKNRLDALAVIAKTTKEDTCYTAYKAYKKEYYEAITASERKRNTERIRTSENKVQTTWKLINAEISNTEGDLSRHSNLTVHEMNTYFCRIGTDIANGIVGGTDALQAMKSDFRSVGSCFFEPVSKEEIERTIRNLKSKESRDIYGMNAKIMKYICGDISEHLTGIINICLAEGYFPGPLKLARVVPIHKDSDINECKNYRPISVLPVVSKIFEQIISSRLLGYLEKKHYLTKNQHAYRKTRSTTTALVSVLRVINDALDGNRVARMNLLDLSKAFDTVDRDILLGKLEIYGVRGQPLKLIESYLSDRKQMVDWGGRRSHLEYITHGVPQGSILGPLLFIVYMNDLPGAVPGVEICLYADDTSIIMTHENEQGLEAMSHEVLESTKRWFASNKLKLNADKTQQLTVKTKPEEHATVRFLGLTVDDGLKWKSHIDQLAKKLAAGIYAIRRIKLIATHHAAVLTYYAAFHSHLSYGVLFWGMSSAVERIFVLQKRAVRALCGLRCGESCRGYFRQQGVLTMPSLFIYQALKYVHGNRGEYEESGAGHEHNTRGCHNLRVPRHRMAMTQRNPHYWGIKLFNHLSRNIRDLGSPRFAVRIRKALIQGEYYTLKEFLDDGDFGRNVCPP